MVRSSSTHESVSNPSARKPIERMPVTIAAAK
jgi:hypothetical protein